MSPGASSMHLVGVPDCPIDGTRGAIRYADVPDAFFGTPGRWHYRQHGQTGHLWLDPRPFGLSIGELYANYYTHSAGPTPSETGLWEQAVNLALSARLGYPSPKNPSVLAKLLSRLPSVGNTAELEVMRIHASETGRMLDVGCGSGAFLRRMRQAGWEVVGIEPDTRAAARLAAREGWPIYGALEDLLRAREPRFDVIVLGHVIEHLPDPICTFAMLKGLLADGGRILLTTPNAMSMGLRIFGPAWRGLEPPRHFNVFTPDSLRQTLERTGFRVDCMRTDVRLARGIWFFSYLARAGEWNIEIVRPAGHRLLKIAGYAFQLFEAGAARLLPNCGEEIFCVATAVRDAGYSRPETKRR